MKNLIELVTENDLWTGAEGENDENVFLLRFRPHLESFIKTGEYKKRLIITWFYESTDSSLLPSECDLEFMENVENSLVDILESDIQAVLAFVYTSGNEREWNWYMKDKDETIKRINQALSEFEKLPIELTVEEDENWSEYNFVLEGAKE